MAISAEGNSTFRTTKKKFKLTPIKVKHVQPRVKDTTKKFRIQDTNTK